MNKPIIRIEQASDSCVCVSVWELHKKICLLILIMITIVFNCFGYYGFVTNKNRTLNSKITYTLKSTKLLR